MTRPHRTFDVERNLGYRNLPELEHYKQNKHGDGYHPDADQHLSWCRQVLLPYILLQSKRI